MSAPPSVPTERRIAVSTITRRAALGALVTAVLLTTGCGTRVERAAILSAEGHSAAAPAADRGAFGGAPTTSDTRARGRAGPGRPPAAPTARAVRAARSLA